MIFTRVFPLVVLAAIALPNGARALAPVEEAAAAIQQGQFARAEDLLTPLVANRHADPAACYNMSLVRSAQKQYDEAIKLADRAIKGDPNKVEYYIQLGFACTSHLVEVGPMEGSAIAIKMRKAYEKALSLDPKNEPSLVGLMRFYEKAPELVGGNLKKAEDLAQRVREVDPYQGEVELGRLAAGRNDLALALQHYDAAAKLKPEDLATATACGWTLFKMGRKDDARARFEAVLKIDPTYQMAKMGLTETAPPAH